MKSCPPRESASVIHTTITRPPVRRVVHRSRLYELLDTGAQRKLTVVSAPPGYGKTTLVSSWLQERSLDSCWVSLDASGASAQRMMTHLLAALDRLEPGARPPGSNRWAAFLNVLAERRRETVVVIDDYQLAGSPEVNDLLMRLVAHLPPQAHLVVVTRIDPTLPAARLRGQGELLELGESDLVFTLEECRAFLVDLSGIPLTGREVQALWRTTEGWIAGLQILASSMKGRADASNLIRTWEKEPPPLRDYLAEEVLKGLDTRTAAFLERCSILERLSAELCRAVTGRADSREMLREIDRRNLFVSPLDEDRRWFRLHHLFAGVLAARLREDHAEELPDLHRKASEWFNDHDQPLEAISHRLASGDAGGAAELINHHAGWLIAHGELMTVKTWIDSLPEEVCGRFPATVLLRAWAGIVDGRPLTKIEGELDSIQGYGSCEAHVLCLRSHIAGLHGDDEEALKLSERAATMAGGQDSLMSGDAKFRVGVARLISAEVTDAIDLLEAAADESAQAGNLPVAVGALVHQGRAMVDRGELDGGERAYRRALDLATPPDGSRRWLAGWALIGLGEISRIRGNIEGALEHFREGMEAAGSWLDLNSFSTSLGYVLALLTAGREEGAQEALRSAERFAAGASVPRYFVRLVEAHRLLVLLRTGRLREARLRLQESPLGRQGRKESYVEAVASDLESLAQARAALLSGNASRCVELARQVARRASEQQRRLHALHADLLLAQAHWRKEEIGDAISVVQRGLSFAAEHGIVQPYVDEGPVLARILYRARALGVTDPHVGRLLAAFPLEPQGEAAPGSRPRSVEPLRARELEVLSLLSQGLSNKEAAARLCVSVPTVKWHAHAIYAKLAVSSRTQAIARARKLGILPE